MCYGRAADLIVSAGRDRLVRLWKSGSQDCQGELIGHSLVVTAVCLNTGKIEVMFLFHLNFNVA